MKTRVEPKGIALLDIIESINGSVVQHGPHNDRIYVMRLNPDADVCRLITALAALAAKQRYGKICAKIPLSLWSAFQTTGYRKEAQVPRYYCGQTDGLFVSRFFSEQRNKASGYEQQLHLARQARKKTRHRPFRSGRQRPAIDAGRLSDAAEISAIYRKVFDTYPFPIRQAPYLQRMIQKGVPYFCIRVKGKIVAVAAAEIDRAGQNAEMTDFATLPAWQGMGFAGLLLNHMEHKVGQMGVQTAYTIARAASAGMNIVFSRNGYAYAGLLKNHSQICGSIQSMTVWYKTMR